MPQYYSDIMSARDKRFYVFLVAIWAATVIFFFQWWLEPSHVVSTIGMVVNTVLLSWSILLPVWYFSFLGRMRRPIRTIGIPNGRVAMIATKVPSEPWSMVQATLEAMLSQNHPHDTWLADEDPGFEALAWCRENNVKISSRKWAPNYHKSRWPRMRKTKEGNLSFFYDHFGYINYDFVVQLDADHVPEPGYLEEMLRGFNDPTVGYVAAPSICDKNISDSWVVKARTDAEATLHGALQAGYNDGWAPMCIGSHYAVRTQALWECGGLGPELAEDHSTTLLMNAAGWRGAFAIDAIAHGDGPGSFHDSMVQEFQWARSLILIFFHWTPASLKMLSPHLKFQFLFSQLWYPLSGIAMLLSYLLPMFIIVANMPLVKVGYTDFGIHFMPPMVMCILIVLWVQRRGWTRPSNASVMSWQLVLFQFARWPWILAGCLDGTLSTMGGKERHFKVTPKGLLRSPMPMKVLVPYFIVAIGSFGAMLFGQTSGTIGYWYMLLANSLSYLLVITAIIWLHLHEQKSKN